MFILPPTLLAEIVSLLTKSANCEMQIGTLMPGTDWSRFTIYVYK